MTGAIKTAHFDLQRTMECGQFFNYLKLGQGYRVRTHGRVFDVRQEGDRLVFDGVDRRFLGRFFSLDHDPRAIRGSMPPDPWLDKAFAAFGRLRLLRQDPWECLVAFLLSPVSNIPRIQRNLLSVFDATGFEPARMRPAALRRLGLGFRWRFLAAAARHAEKARPDRPREKRAEVGPALGLECWRRKGPDGMDGILGAGPKVKDCVRLFGYEDYSAFPVDTWIRRVLRDLYRVRAKDKDLRLWAARKFGPWAGYGQQWLFAWSRTEWRPGAPGFPARRVIHKPILR